MATLVLGAVGAAVGGSLGGSILGLSGAVVGRAVGATLGRAIDQSILGGGAEAVEIGKLDRLRLTGASEGAPIPRIVGRVRVSGQVIWASRFKESRQTSRSGGKGGPKPPKQTQYSYSVSLAVALCEGEISRVGRVWADGTEIAKSSVQMRVYRGDEEQMPDALIEAIEGVDRAPAFRGTAYVVIEDLELTPFGNRVPQLSFEVVRTVEAEDGLPDLSRMVEGVALVPGTGEYALATTEVHYNRRGVRDSANVNTPQGVSDFRIAMDDLTEELPNLKSASLIVSWFGDDLRCGHCSIRPRAEQTEVDGAGQTWVVSGADRQDAGAVSFLDDRPVYGGTPGDLSVIEAIRDLKSRGIAVTFYPFILMDQLAGNGLPDPYGGAEQAVLPWRGRITTALASDQPGTSDRTALAATEVAQFMGTTVVDDFSHDGVKSGIEGVGRTVTGPDGDWSYRRFILHYALLCAQAGGVDSFCIGSEMRGITRIRGADDSFPAVEALRQLAADVRAILPDAKISYAADWSEYFGYHPKDTGNVHFHLDPLWADPAIDFVAIDNYVPLADWRDGDDHLDAGFKTIRSVDYLQSNIEGGEGYDWYYPTPESRLAQRRVPIEDGAHGEDWIYRYKDFRNWWTNAHHDRVNGVRLEQPTAWVPQSKPIRFTEFGCAAIDKGANQPNKFVDLKSSESSLPRFSDGRRDDAMQMQYLRAMLDHWSRPEANPVSAVYGGPMLDLGGSLVWAWDTRPWPYFPELSDYWTDAENHARGHWLSGRVGLQPLDSVIAEICRSVGLKDFDVSGVDGMVRGYVMPDVQSARADLQPLLIAHAVEASERGGRIVFGMRARAEETAVVSNGLVRSDGPVVARQRAPEIEEPRRILLSHMDAEGDFEVRMADATLPGERPLPVGQSELPLSLTRSEAHGIAERFLTETQIARDTIELELPPSARLHKPGDLIRVDGATDLWRIDRIEDAGGRKVQAVRTERAQYEPSDRVEDGTGRQRPLAPLPVDATFLDLPLLTGEEIPHAPHIAVSGRPWPGTVAVQSGMQDANYRLDTFIDAPNVVGITESELAPAAPSLIDSGPDLLVRLIGDDDLESVEMQSLLAGANTVAINDGGLTGWEIFQFQTARLVAPGLWALSRRLRGQRGTEWAIRNPWPVGSTVVFLDRTLAQLDVPREALWIERHYRVGPADQPIDSAAYTYYPIVAEGMGLRPYAPAHLRISVEEGTRMARWVRRSRLAADGWDGYDVPLGEARESYRLRVLRGDGSVAHEQSVVRTEATIPETAIDPQGHGALTLEVSQVSDEVGPGTPATITIA
ncbi:baseplate multidomain protein megatron [Jannaschia marina]|uniref:baseplate multidomain protein megatron n=1 Tax=Jannaschia marina TaxID=2741674 RepID=UPI0015C82785|nr:glycoside hydrolase/phage tail family protein [Jannaschia marina]